METIVLRDVEIVDNNGKFEKQYTNEQRFPASITNYSLYMGEKLGLLEGSQITDIEDVQKLFDQVLTENVTEEQMLKEIDLNRYLKIIYLSIIGTTPHLNLTYDDFVKRY